MTSKSFVPNATCFLSHTTIRHKVADSAEVRHNLAARTSSSELRRGQPWLRQEPPDKAKRGASPELEKVVSLNRGFVGTQRGLQANAVPRPAGPVSTAASRLFWRLQGACDRFPVGM